MNLPPWVSRAGLRLRPYLPERCWPPLLELGSLVTDVPLVGLPAFSRVLVLAPHPDDETIGCGGTLALLAARGARVAVLVATDGEASIGAPFPREEVAQRRRREAAVACVALGLTDPPVSLGLPDGGLADARAELTAAIAEVAARLRPEVVLTPWLLDRHPDHLVTTRVLVDVDLPAATEIWGYEAHVPLTPTRAVAIDQVVDRKRAALGAHETAAFAMDLDATLALNRWRSLITGGGRGHAEVFHAVLRDRFLDLVARLDRAAG